MFLKIFPETMSPVMESAKGFVLGAVAGGTLGATEVPVNQIMQDIISGAQLKPVVSGIKSLGALGLGALLGTTALITSMTLVVTGVTVAASVALCLLRLRKTEGWVAAGLAAALTMTSSGAALGAIIENLSMSYGMVSLLGDLGIFTVLKLLIHYFVKYTCMERKFCESITDATKREQARLLALEVDLRQRAALELEKRIKACEMKKPEEDGLAAWEALRRKREEIKRQQREMQKRNSRQRLLKAVAKYMEFLAFSGIPMTVTTFVTTGFGIFGFGDYRFVFVICGVMHVVLAHEFLAFELLDAYGMHGNVCHICHFSADCSCRAGGGRNVCQNALGRTRRKQGEYKHPYDSRILRTGNFCRILCVRSLFGLGATIGGPVAREAGGKVILGASVTAVVVFGDS